MAERWQASSREESVPSLKGFEEQSPGTGGEERERESCEASESHNNWRPGRDIETRRFILTLH